MQLTILIYILVLVRPWLASAVCYSPVLRDSVKAVNIRRAGEGTIIELKCGDNYVEGSANISCINGKWTEPTFQCQLVTCPYLEEPLHGKIDAPCQNRNCTSTFRCDDGFTYTGDVIRECQRNETWSGKEGECKAVVCPELPKPDNGDIDQSNRSYNAVAKIVCDEGYNYSKPEYISRRCQGNNTWTREEGACERIFCPNIKEEHNGMITASSGRYGDTVTLRCYSGHTLDGPGHITCLSSGTWSPDLGSCTQYKGVGTILIVTLLLGIVVGLAIGAILSAVILRNCGCRNHKKVPVSGDEGEAQHMV